jgi:hypothetical protein
VWASLVPRKIRLWSGLCPRISRFSIDLKSERFLAAFLLAYELELIMLCKQEVILGAQALFTPARQTQRQLRSVRRSVSSAVCQSQ